MSQGFNESPEGGLTRDADIKILVRYYWDDFTEEWSLDLMTEGLNPGEEVEQVDELLENTLRVVREGGITFD
jgi:hypothetical protein